MKSLKNKEQMDKNLAGNGFLENVLEKVSAPSYPLLISEDRRGFEKSVDDFLSVIKHQIAIVKVTYEGLGLEEPFDDYTFHQLCENTSLAEQRYSKKVNKIADLIGVNSGLVDSEILIKRHPNLSKLTLVQSNLLPSLSRVWDQSKAQLRPGDVINVNTKPALNQNAYDEHLEAYRAYVHNPREHMLKLEIDQFANSHNKFINFLKNQGYGQHLNGLNPHSYLNNFFTQEESYGLVPHANAQTFLATFKKPEIIVA